MSKRSRAATATSVQLFPFLAVLLCAMGGLILLLVVITGKNRDVGRVLADLALQDRIALAERRNELEWQLEFVSAARDKTAQQLAGRRAALAALESQARDLRDEIAELESAVQQLQQSTRSESMNAAQIEQQIAQLNQQSKQKEDELKRVREQIRQFEDSYAVVPYEGPNSTRRRPIYIECVANAVILQPEGIRLIEDDFVFSEGPNNPLAASLRAAREYLIKNRYVGGKDNGDPYPLLLVRPDGIGAYYAARHAMTSWGAEFGYELIEQDWKIAYRPVDPGLTLAMSRAVEDARQRGLALAKAAPGLLDPEQRKLYRSAFAAGRSSTAGGGLGGDGEDGGSLSRGSGQRGSFGGGGSPGVRGGSKSPGRYGSGYAGATGGGGATGVASGGVARGRGNGFGPGGDGEGDGLYSGNGPRSGDDPSTLPYGQIAAAGAGGAATADGNPAGNGTGDQLTSSETRSTSKGKGVPGGDPAQGTSESGKSGKGGGGKSSGQGTAVGAGSNSGATARGSSSGTASQGSAGGGSEGGFGDGGGQSVTTTMDQSPQSAAATVNVTPQSLAKKRGRDWGLPEKARSAVPLTRPISVRLSGDELTLLAESGNPTENKTLSLKPRTEDSVDELVKSVWNQVESWNLAGQGMYWRPVIVAHVTPDGEQRFNDLQSLMADSGLDVKRGTVPRRR